MFTLLILLSQLPVATVAFPLCARDPEESGHAGEEGERGFGFPENPLGTPSRLL